MENKSSKKYLVVGGVAGGMSAAARIKRLDPYAEVIVYEKGPDVSFSNCCLPYYLSDVVSPVEKLIILTPQVLKAQYNLDVRVNHEVVAIDREKCELVIKDLLKNEEIRENYDYLVLSPGADAVRPKDIKGIDKKHIFTVKNVVDIDNLRNYVDGNAVEDVVVLGGGFIGIEVMENLKHANKNVTLVEARDQIMAPIDYDMVQILHKEIMDNGVDLILNDKVVEIQDDKVILESGKEINAKAVVLSIGVVPSARLAVEAGLEIGKTGGILVNHNYQTSDPKIYAVGDVIEVTNLITRQKTRLALAGPAQRQARAAADHMFGRTYKNTGVIGSSVVQCFGMNAASTGLNTRQCEEMGYPYDYSYVIPKDKVGLMPEANPIYLKLIFDKYTGQILGAQSIGKGNVEKRMDVVAALLMMKGNVEDLKEMELCYAPPFSTAKDALNMAALVATNVMNGEYKQAHVSDVRGLWEDGAFFIDAREEGEYAEGHVKGAVNIPLSQFRERLDEIPTDKPVYVYCLSAQRSYYMTRELNNRGFKNAINVAGSFLGISINEYFNDVTLKREPIVTNYRFKLL